MGKLYGLETGKRCNADLTKGSEHDHVLRACDGGDNDLANCLRVCIPCHRYKTSKFDVPQAAKTKRVRDRAKGITKPKGKIKSAGFDKVEKKTKIDKSKLPEIPRRKMFG